MIKDIKKLTFVITQVLLLITTIIVCLIGINYDTIVLIPMIPIITAEIAILVMRYVDLKSK